MVRLTRLRRRSSGDVSAGCGMSIRRAESAKPSASLTVGPGWVASRTAAPATPPRNRRPAENVVCGSCLMLSRSRSSPVTSRGTGTGGIGRGSGSRSVS